MNNLSSDITFILGLKGRPDYTKSWLKNNVRPGYNYHVADGSLDDENAKIFENNKLGYLFYKFYDKDDSVRKYLNKFHQAILACDTEYVMLCDNDDFINHKGIDECIRVLNEHKDYTCAGGQVYAVFASKNNPDLYTFTIPNMNATTLHNVSNPYQAFQSIRRVYYYLWYAVYRKEALLKIWEKIIELDVEDYFLLEMVQVDLALIYGKYYHTNHNHYIRLMNAVSSTASSLGENYHKKIFFNEKYRQELVKICSMYAKLFNKELDEIFLEQQNFYVWYFKQAPRIKNSLMRKIHGAIMRVPIFPIGTIIRIVNFYSSIKKTFEKRP